MMKVSEFFIIFPPTIQFILMKQIGFISIILFCCIFAAAKIPVYSYCLKVIVSVL